MTEKLNFFDTLIEQDNNEIVMQLVCFGFTTPAMIAEGLLTSSSSGNIVITEYFCNLLQKRHIEQYTCFMAAVNANNQAALSLLSEQNTRWNEIINESLKSAASRGHSKIIAHLLEQYKVSNFGTSQALAWACAFKHKTVATHLLNLGASLQHEEHHALTTVIDQSHWEIKDLLLDYYTSGDFDDLAKIMSSSTHYMMQSTREVIQSILLDREISTSLDAISSKCSDVKEQVIKNSL
ncbi:MAG: hypothetical protein HAW67_03255 [Endozoicomonadaceae bacterium]|nr:hypothetical protein [Endozoicomonadaceae bacterium]